MPKDAVLADALPDALAAVRRQLALEPDGWAPTVQRSVAALEAYLAERT